MVRLAVLVTVPAIVLFAVGQGHCVPKPVSPEELTHYVEASKGDIKFILSLPKTEFMEGEPIFGQYTIVNTADRPRMIAEPRSGITSALLTQVSGTQSLPAEFHYDFPAPPDDYGWQFAPGEAKTYWIEIGTFYTDAIPAGDYTVRARYSRPKIMSDIVYDIWQGSIETGELAFRITETPSKYAEISKQFTKARVKLVHPNRSRESLLETAKVMEWLSDPLVGGPFAWHAGYCGVLAYQFAGENDLQVFAILARYVDDQIYGQRAVRLLVSLYYENEDYSSAREMLLRLPEGYDRQQELNRCQAKLEEKQEDVED